MTLTNSLDLEYKETLAKAIKNSKEFKDWLLKAYLKNVFNQRGDYYYELLNNYTNYIQELEKDHEKTTRRITQRVENNKHRTDV